MLGLRTHALFVDDLAAAKAWYTRVVGKAPYFDEPFYVGFDVGGYELGLLPAEGDARAAVQGSRVYWGVHDIAAEVARIVQLGATVLEPPTDVGGGIVTATVRDPFGNALGLVVNPHFASGATFLPDGHRLGAATGDVSERAIVKEVEVAAPPAAVWPLWTTSDGIRWLVHRAHIQLRLGGPYELYFLDEAPEGARGSEGCRVLSWIPGRMVSFTWNAPPHLTTTRRAHTWVVVELEPTSSGTRVRVTHLGWPASHIADLSTEWPATYAYFDRAWGNVLQALVAHVAQGGQVV
jgi:uncharacterized protein YndB with AHSA1/START domain/predicted enzyme related to lactoylglutathione lyase